MPSSNNRKESPGVTDGRPVFLGRRTSRIPSPQIHRTSASSKGHSPSYKTVWPGPFATSSWLIHICSCRCLRLRVPSPSVYLQNAFAALRETITNTSYIRVHINSSDFRHRLLCGSFFLSRCSAESFAAKSCGTPPRVSGRQDQFSRETGSPSLSRNLACGLRPLFRKIGWSMRNHQSEARSMCSVSGPLQPIV